MPVQDRVAAETERLKAEAELEKARAARVAAWSLPSFERKTTLGAGGGAIEGAMLAAEAVKGAANAIAGAARNLLQGDGAGRFFLVLAGDETMDFTPFTATRIEMAALLEAFDAVLPLEPGRQALAAPLAAPVAVAQALLGLLGTETTITGTDAPLSHRTLATAVVAEMTDVALLASTVSGATEFPAVGQRPEHSLIAEMAALHRRRDAAAAIDQSDPLKPQLLALVARFDAFEARINTPDLAGSVTWVRAVALDRILSSRPLLLRVYVEKAGGTLTNRTNLWSFFGFDPVRVSGGVVASYTIVDPETGRVRAADVFGKGSRSVGIRKLQSSKGGFA